MTPGAPRACDNGEFAVVLGCITAIASATAFA
ncbi:hypothetical protein T190_18740 [Sinorhizobium meliloti CCBAU 01290]|nr:hypothetical protein T190_18740 [Sinorhizobium meliloti CCBAU 01290]